MTGPEVRWTERGSDRRRRQAAKSIRWPLRPRLAPKPAPVATVCTSVSYPNVKAPVVPGRYVCQGCAARIDARADEHRRRVK